MEQQKRDMEKSLNLFYYPLRNCLNEYNLEIIPDEKLNRP